MNLEDSKKLLGIIADSVDSSTWCYLVDWSTRYDSHFRISRCFTPRILTRLNLL